MVCVSPALLAGYMRVCLDTLNNQVGVDSAWGQKNPEGFAKMLENAAKSHKSTARFVRRYYALQ